MKDFILRFKNKSAAEKQMGLWCVNDDLGDKIWKPLKHCGINEISVVVSDAVLPVGPESTKPIKIKKFARGFWLCISIPDKGDKGYSRNRHKKMISDLKKTTGFKRRFSRPKSRRKSFKESAYIVDDKMTVSEKSKFIRFEPIPSGGLYKA